MNLTVITGTIATIPRYRLRGFVPTTTFDIHVDVARRTDTFHIRAMNDLAKRSRLLHPGVPVTIIGYLHAEPNDMPDRSIWHRVEIVADRIEPRINPTEITDCVVTSDP